MNYLDIESIRHDFPILHQKVYGKSLVYLDNGATTQKPECVVKKIEEMYYLYNSNIHRGVHYLSDHSTEFFEGAREVVRQYINAERSSEIIFTGGATESINLVANSFCKAFCSEGDEIIVSTMEHHANIVPWQLQKDITGVNLRVIPINDKGELEIAVLENLISEKTKLISLIHVSNVLGTINPIDKVIEIAHRYNIPVLIDASQSVQHMPLDVQSLDCDFLVFSGHKVYGPTGTGVLYGKDKWLEQMPPYKGGGEMISNVSFEKTTFNELPYKFEAGTPNYVGFIGLAEALKYISSIGLNNILNHERELLDYATKRFNEIPEIKIYGTADKKSSVISFLPSDVHHFDMGSLLDKMGVAVRTGHHCAQPLMKRFGISGTVRASFAMYNTKEEIDILIESVKRAISMLRG